ncbi:MAG: hypothetical protein ACI9X0_002562, partial [Kiritimatiellia bacterium]
QSEGGHAPSTTVKDMEQRRLGVSIAPVRKRLHGWAQDLWSVV